MSEEIEVVDEIIVTDEIVEAPTDEPKRRGRPPKVKVAKVKNLHESPINVMGVEIPVGGSSDVPGFDPDHAVVKAWLDGNVISVVE